MEIVDYLRVARRRLWVLIGVPLIAAGVTVYLVLSAPAAYTASGTVSAPALIGGSTSNQYSGSQAVNQFVAQFQATAQSPMVRSTVHDKTGLSRTDISDGLTVTQVGASSVMNLDFTSPKQGVAQPVLTALTRATLDAMFSSQVTLAEGQLTEANTAVKTANAAIVSWEKKNNMVDPTRVYQSQLDRIGNLQQQQVTLSANGNSAAAAAVSATIATARQDLPKFGPLLGEYQLLTAQRDAAVASVTQTQQQLLTAHAQEAAADPQKVAFVSPDHRVDSGSTLLTTVLPVTGAAVFVAVALVAMLELLSRSRSLAGAGAHVEKRSRRSKRPASREAAKAASAGARVGAPYPVPASGSPNGAAARSSVDTKSDGKVSPVVLTSQSK